MKFGFVDEHCHIGRYTLDEPQRRLSGQRANGELLSQPQDRAGSPSVYGTRAEARRDLFQYIEGFYNSHRLHSALRYVSPAR